MTSDYPNLPTKPRIPKYFYVIPMEGNRIQFHTAGKTVLLEGKLVETLIPALLELLDGTHTIAEIVTALERFGEEPVVTALNRLQAKGLLEDATTLPPDALSQAELEHYDTQITFFSHFLHDPFAGQVALRNARVTVVGIGSMGWHAAVSLAAAGVGHLCATDPWHVAVSDCIAGGAWRADDVDRSRPAVLGDYLRQYYPQVAFKQSYELPAGVDDARQLARACDLVILCQDKPDVSLCRWVNQACIELGVAWIGGHLDGPAATIGPLVVPGETACYECYRLRCQSNQEMFDERQALEQYLEQYRGARPVYGQVSPLAFIVGGHLALEALKRLTSLAQPATYNCILSLDLLTVQGELRPLLKIPRCPVCSSLRNSPLTRMWLEE